MAWHKGELAVAKRSQWNNRVRGDLLAGYDNVPKKGGVYKVDQVFVRRGREFLSLVEFPKLIFAAPAFEKVSPATTEFTEMIRGLSGGGLKRVKEDAVV